MILRWGWWPYHRGGGDIERSASLKAAPSSACSSAPPAWLRLAWLWWWWWWWEWWWWWWVWLWWWWFLWPKLLHGRLVLNDCRHVEVAAVPNHHLPHLTIVKIIIVIIIITIVVIIIIITNVVIIISTFSSWSPAWSFPDVLAMPRGCNPQMYVRIMSRSCSSSSWKWWSWTWKWWSWWSWLSTLAPAKLSPRP